MRIEPFYDRTTLVGLTLETVHHSLLFGALLVAGVVWLFLRSLRCSLIVASVIPSPCSRRSSACAFSGFRRT